MYEALSSWSKRPYANFITALLRFTAGKKDCLLELLKAGADARACDVLGRSSMHLLLLQGIGYTSSLRPDTLVA